MSNFIKTLKDYVPFDKQDAADRQAILDFYKKYNGDIFTRDNAEGHMVTCCLVMNPERTKVLMAWHNIYKTFAWLGGHADGDEDLARVARKEVSQESGLKHAKMLGDIILTVSLLVVPYVRKGKIVEAHKHLGFVYLFEASEVEPIRIAPKENSHIEWIPIEKIPKKIAESDRHMLAYYARIMDRVRKERL